MDGDVHSVPAWFGEPRVGHWRTNHFSGLFEYARLIERSEEEDHFVNVEIRAEFKYIS